MPRIFISIILFGLSFVLGVVFLWPQYQEINNLLLRIENTELNIRYQEEYYKELLVLDEKLGEYQEDITKIDSALPPDILPTTFLKFLQKITSENGLILTGVSSFSSKPVPGKIDIKEGEASLSLAGSYSALKNFLVTLEKSARLIEVDSISFGASPSQFGPEETEGEVSETFGFQLRIKIHSY